MTDKDLRERLKKYADNADEWVQAQEDDSIQLLTIAVTIAAAYGAASELLTQYGPFEGYARINEAMNEASVMALDIGDGIYGVGGDDR